MTEGFRFLRIIVAVVTTPVFCGNALHRRLPLAPGRQETGVAAEARGVDGTQSGDAVRAHVPSGRRQSRCLRRGAAPQLLRLDPHREGAVVLRLHRQRHHGVPRRPLRSSTTRLGRTAPPTRSSQWRCVGLGDQCRHRGWMSRAAQDSTLA